MEGETKNMVWLWKICRNNLLVILTVFGVLLGLVLGFGIREAHPSKDAILWIGLSGEVYMRMLKMMILPLIISTVITGTASLNPKSQGRVSIVSVGYIAASNTIPAIIGALIVLIFNPGADTQRSTKPSSGSGSNTVMQTQDIFADVIRNLFPDNIVTAAFQQTITKYEVHELYQLINDTNISSTEVNKYIGKTNGTNVLGLIICCTLFGVATSSLGKSGKPFLKFFQSASEIILRILRWLIWFTPVGVASLIATVLAQTNDLSETFKSLGMFILAAIMGLIVFMFVVTPLAYFALIRKNPFPFFTSILRPMMITFATASTAISIPDTLFVMEKKNNVDKRITRFVVPFSSTLNKAGSSLYIAASIVFISQLENIETDGANIVIVIILTALSTFAVPSVPSAGIVTIIILLTAMNIPADSVGLLLAVEWFLDRCRTAGNLYSQVLCVAVTEKYANLQTTSEPDKADFTDMDLEIIVDKLGNDEKSSVLKQNETFEPESEKLVTNGNCHISIAGDEKSSQNMNGNLNSQIRMQGYC